jgi:hypothetical protein
MVLFVLTASNELDRIINESLNLMGAIWFGLDPYFDL